MTIRDPIPEPAQPAPRRRAGPDGASSLFAAGSLLGAVAASACCVLPPALLGLGVGSAWIGRLAIFAPYRHVFLALAVGCLGAGFWWIRRRARAACAGEASCARPTAVVRGAFWAAGVLILATLVVPSLVPS